MSYELAMEAAGAEVLEFEQFGSYSGDWWAKVRVSGREGWVNGAYGSCSGCDAFESEFGYSDDHKHGEQWVFSNEQRTPLTCEKCADYQRRLVSFGHRYVNDLYTQEEAEKVAAQYIEWDHDAQEMVAFIREHAIKTE